jgi:hypothetical protein
MAKHLYCRLNYSEKEKCLELTKVELAVRVDARG